MPFPRVLRGEAWPDPAVQSIVRGTREAAVQRGELFTDTRHLCDAILRSRSASVQRTLRDATWSREQALTELWEGRLFAGPYTWLNDLFLQPIGLKTGSDELILSPKVGFLLEECQRRSRRLLGGGARDDAPPRAPDAAQAGHGERRRLVARPAASGRCPEGRAETVAASSRHPGLRHTPRLAPSPSGQIRRPPPRRRSP